MLMPLLYVASAAVGAAVSWLLQNRKYTDKLTELTREMDGLRVRASEHAASLATARAQVEAAQVQVSAAKLQVEVAQTECEVARKEAAVTLQEAEVRVRAAIGAEVEARHRTRANEIEQEGRTRAQQSEQEGRTNDCRCAAASG
jgi:acyl-CoA synthetase (NDP forming)